MSIQINVHLEADKPLKAKTVFATILEISQIAVVCFQLDEMNIYFHSREQIDQVLTALTEAREKMAELWAKTVGLTPIPPSQASDEASNDWPYFVEGQERADYFDAKRRGDDV